MSISLDVKKEEWAQAERAGADKLLRGGFDVSNFAHDSKIMWTCQGRQLSQVRLKSPDSLQLQCLLFWPTGRTAGSLQHADNRAE